MPAGFVGRASELARLRSIVERFGQAPTSQVGQLLLLRGRRQVGKSRLLQEFIERSGLPSFFFAAGRGSSRLEAARFAREVAVSTLPDAGVARELPPAQDWHQALRVVASAVSSARPSIIVVDEFPYLVGKDGEVEAAFQHAWDRRFSDRPVLLVLIGSDLAMMRQVSDHGRPLGMRGRLMSLGPLGPHETAGAVGLSPADAIDAHAVHGGYPNVLAEWRNGETVVGFLHRELLDPTSPLVVAGERVVSAEFPDGEYVRRVLDVIADGRVTNKRIKQRSGIGSPDTLTAQLDRLVRSDVVERRLPLSTASSREVRYEVVDPYLRFWLRFVGPGLAPIQRGTGAAVAVRVVEALPSYLGLSVETVVRGLLPRLRPEWAELHFGGWWNRQHNPELDIVGADRPVPPARSIKLVGSVKWRSSAAFSTQDARALRSGREAVPGAQGAPLVGVSRAGFADESLDVRLVPEDLVRLHDTPWQQGLFVV